MENDLIRRGDALCVVADNNRTDYMSLDCYDRLIDGLAQLPAVDAVEVVRCFCCKHWQMPRSEKTIPWCDHLKTVMHASDFCNYGQRREDGDA